MRVGAARIQCNNLYDANAFYYRQSLERGRHTLPLFTLQPPIVRFTKRERRKKHSKNYPTYLARPIIIIWENLKNYSRKYFF